MKRGAPTGEAILLLRAWFAALFQIVFLCALAIVLLGRPWVFDHYYYRIVKGGERRDAERIVNWLSSSEPMGTMNTRLQHGQLTEKELRHFADVRRFFGRFPLVCGFSLALWLGMVWSQWCRDFMIMIQIRALLACGILLLCAWALAIWDWRVFFAWIHYPFFGATSWRFPTSSYSLRLFPASFWKAMGVVVVVTPIAVSTSLILALRKGVEQPRPDNVSS